jgi:hypothetical protein
MQNEKKKLRAITTPGEYNVRICNIKPDDVGQTKKGDPMVRLLMTTQDGQAINERFFASTDGALRRAAAFVSVATGKKMALPPKDAESFAMFIGKASGNVIRVLVEQKEETWTDGTTKQVMKIARFMPIQGGTQTPMRPIQTQVELPPPAPEPTIKTNQEPKKKQWFDYDGNEPTDESVPF